MDALNQMNVNIEKLKAALEQSARKVATGTDVNPSDDMVFDEAANRIMRLSVLESMVTRSDIIEVEHIMLAILRDNECEANKLLKEQDVTYQRMNQAFNPQLNTNATYRGFTDEEDLDEEGNGQDGETRTKTRTTDERLSDTPILDKFGTDLTQAAREHLLDPVVGREKEIERMAQILSRRKKNNPVLIGEPGVGKSAIVEGIAQRIVEHRVSRVLWNQRVIMLDLGAIVAGTKYRGQFEERVRAIITELKKHPEIIVFIDEIHTLIGAGSAAGTMDAANMLKPALSRGEIQCIGATTLDEYRKSIEKDGALERRFQKVMVAPTSLGETLEILHNLRSRYEEHHNVTYTDEALEACVKLTERYVSDRCFPDKAIDAMDEAGARIHIMNIPTNPELEKLEKHVEELGSLKEKAVKAEEYKQAAEYNEQQKLTQTALKQKQKEWEKTLKEAPQTVDAEQIANVVAMMTGIPAQRIGQEEHKKLRHLAEQLQQQVVGQEEAIRCVTRAIQRSRVGLKDPQKPIGAFMFVGPTGVGKTHLTKKLAEELFGTADALIRIDMSEYMEKHTVSRMVGAPPGYVGYDEGGQLTEKVKRHPYSIVLFDELEKAHPDVFNMLLQVMDEGRLTDGNGATIDFRNTIIIMTSNCGTRQLKDFGNGVGFASSNDTVSDKRLTRSIIKKSITKQFAPEFLNRIDDIIYFDQLSEEDIKQIVDIELRPLAERIEEMGYTLELTEEAKTLLAQKGYDIQYGARPLKRAIQTLLEDPLCEWLMSDNQPESGVLKVDANGEKIEVEINQ